QLIDLNALCNEYFNLAYHGMRANNAEFNCSIEKELAADLPKINIIPQDISRVLINLFNNAFYAVKERSQKLEAGGQKSDSYKPLVHLSTSSLNNFITIKIRDNGTGVPDAIKEKIFVPFFTTKPTGQGTGLGLSLSYDIVKAHGGEITVESKEGEGAEFAVSLPL
ncbi:MAG: ATP-binding protein, partial [Bacteroidota bacterium]